MKIYFYALRKFDELSFAREYAEKYGSNLILRRIIRTKRTIFWQKEPMPSA